MIKFLRNLFRKKCPHEKGGKIKDVYLFSGNTLARKNLEKHFETGDIEKIQKQIKRGSIKPYKMPKP